MAASRRCSVGRHIENEVCSTEFRFKPEKCIPLHEQALLKRRTNCSHIHSVCKAHQLKYLRYYAANQKLCCNPFSLHPPNSKSLWTVTNKLDVKCQAKGMAIVMEGKKLCPTCKVKVFAAIKRSEPALQPGAAASRPVVRRLEEQHVSQEISLHSGIYKTNCAAALPSATSSESSSSSSFEDEKKTGAVNFSPRVAKLARLNESIQSLGESPLNVKKLRQSERYVASKIKKAQKSLKKSIQNVIQTNEDLKDSAAISSDESADYEEAGCVMLKQLREKFQKTHKFSEKIAILSLAPSTWHKSKIIDFFGATRYMVDKTMQCVKEQGILCSPNPRRGKRLSDDTLKKIKDFFYEPDISRELPGKKDCKSVVENNTRVLKQKRQVLGNLNELYEEFKQRNPEHKVGFSVFCERRPPECVLAGSSGTHSVCVCLIHQNFKLMFARLQSLSFPDGQVLFKEYRDILRATICSTPADECYMGGCNSCAGSTALRETLNNLLEENFIEDITFQQWQKVDRFSLSTLTLTSDDFIDKLIESIPAVAKHDFVAKAQSEYFRKRKEELKEDEVIVIADFSENYSFVIQDSVQGVHWSHSQATVHPFAGYYRNRDTHQVEPLNLTVISDCLDHLTSTVHAFQRELVKYLRQKVPGLKRIVYFSDGCAAQYKNRFNAINVLMHKADFGVQAEWHFYATSHGKGPSDGLGGTLKRNATRASMQLPSEKQILTPMALYEWAVSKLPNMNFVFVKQEDVAAQSRLLASRFRQTPEVKGIQKGHALIPISLSAIRLKVLSRMHHGQDFVMRDQDSNPELLVEVPERVTRSSARRAAQRNQ